MTAQQRDHLLLQMNEKLNQMATKEELATQMLDIKQELRNLSQTVAKIEVEHGQKLEALFDAFEMHDQRFSIQENRITMCEKKVNKHDDKIYYLSQRVWGK